MTELAEATSLGVSYVIYYRYNIQAWHMMGAVTFTFVWTMESITLIFRPVFWTWSKDLFCVTTTEGLEGTKQGEGYKMCDSHRRKDSSHILVLLSCNRCINVFLILFFNWQWRLSCHLWLFCLLGERQVCKRSWINSSILLQSVSIYNSFSAHSKT